MTSGLLGKKLVDTDKFDKSNLFDNIECYRPQNIKELNEEDNYFARSVKDGIYLDYIKQLLFSYNIYTPLGCTSVTALKR